MRLATGSSEWSLPRARANKALLGWEIATILIFQRLIVKRKKQDNWRKSQLAKLRKQIALGLAQLDGGEGIPGEKVFEELRKKSQRPRRNKPSKEVSNPFE